MLIFAEKMFSWENIKKSVKRNSIYKNWLLRKQLNQADSIPNFDRGDFKNIRTLVIYIGNARSGHSVHGKLLNAHKEVLLPDEVDILNYMDNKWSVKHIFNYLAFMSKQQSIVNNKKSTFQKSFSYNIPNQYLGTYESPKIIGASKAAVTTIKLSRRNYDISIFNKYFNLETKFIHCLRHPLDNIATLTLNSGSKKIEDNIAHYFKVISHVKELKKQIKDDCFFEYKHEDLIANPQEELRRVCDFLRIDVTHDYLDSCASILFSSPFKSRTKVAFTDSHLKEVQRLIDLHKLPYLLED